MGRRQGRAGQMAAKRKQETPEQRAARLESMRNYARRVRAGETPDQREERLKAMRVYSRRVREQHESEMRRQRVRSVIERIKEAHVSKPPEEIDPIAFVVVEMSNTETLDA